MIARPFTKVAFCYGEPVSVPRQADEGELEALRLRLQAAMDSATEEAEAALRRKAL